MRGLQLEHRPLAPLVDKHGQVRSRIRPFQPVGADCGLCRARCCRLRVDVSVSDALRYCGLLELPFFAGLRLVEAPDPSLGFSLDRDPRVVHPEDPWSGRAGIQLRRAEDGGCASLLRVGGYERCGCYAARPDHCRTYPASWRSDAHRGGPPSLECQLPYAIDPAREASMQVAIQAAVDAWSLHAELCAEWNAGTDRDLEALLGFIATRGADRAGLDPGPLLASGGPPRRLHEARRQAKLCRTAPDPDDVGIGGSPAHAPRADDRLWRPS